MPRPVAYLGPKGTFSHLVAVKRFGESANLVACGSIGSIFQEMVDDPAARAVVPIENSSGGTIYDTVDLLIENEGRIVVTESIALDVRLALLGRRGGPVRKVFSHFVPLQHHKDWLKENLPDAEPVAVASTAIAAEMAARTRGGAAFSAPGAAALYGLEILRFPIGPEKANVTSFVVLDRQPARLRGQKAVRTAVAVSFGNIAGSLYRFLAPFSRWKININRIVSRPYVGRPEQSVFFMEIDGKPGDAAFDRAMAVARARSEMLIELGSYPCGRKLKS